MVAVTLTTMAIAMMLVRVVIVVRGMIVMIVVMVPEARALCASPSPRKVHSAVQSG